MTLEDLRNRVDSMGWYHSIDLGNGIVTKGLSQSPVLEGDALPIFTDRTVLDIGAWDGYYSFQAERLGARSVVALDNYAWCLDFGARDEYWRQCRDRGVVPDPERDFTDFWRADAPNRAGFDLAREVLQSHVEPRIADYMTDDLGTFDIVMYLGVLYHVRDPLAALERVRRFTKEVAVIETAAVEVKGYKDARLLSFYPGDDLDADFGNWYLPSESALHGLCKAAGFKRTTTVRRHGFPDPPRRPWKRYAPYATRSYRLAVHAFP